MKYLLILIISSVSVTLIAQDLASIVGLHRNVTDNRKYLPEEVGNSINSKENLDLASQQHLLDIHTSADKNTTFSRQFISLQNTNNSSFSNVGILMRSGTDLNEVVGSIGVTAHSYTATQAIPGYSYMLNKGSGISLRAIGDNGVIKFNTGGEGSPFERMRIDVTGKIGIGTDQPLTRLQVAAGDIYLSDVEAGVIMKSPNGTCFRMTVSDAGAAVFTQLPSCP